MPKWVRVIKVEDKLIPLRCGYCGSLLYGYDEEVCPVCRSFNDMDNPRYVKVEPENFHKLN